MKLEIPFQALPHDSKSQLSKDDILVLDASQVSPAVIKNRTER